IDKRWAVFIEKRDEADASLLRLSSGERLSLRMVKLTSKRLVLALGGLDDLGVELFEGVLQAAGCRARRALERRIDLGDTRGELLHPILQEAVDVLHRRVDVRRQLRREELVQQRFILRL